MKGLKRHWKNGKQRVRGFLKTKWRIIFPRESQYGIRRVENTGVSEPLRKVNVLTFMVDI